MATAPTILIVDDQEPNRRLLNDLVISLGYRPTTAENGLAALTHIRRDPPDLVLLDIMMPDMDGYEVLERLAKDGLLKSMPVIVVSAVEDIASVVRCIECGAEDYLVKPFDAALLEARLHNSLERKELRDGEKRFHEQIEEYSMRLEERVSEQVRSISSAQLGTIFAMSKLVESRDRETGGHLERIREYCKILSEQLGKTPKFRSIIDAAFVENLYAASPLHDIGKVAIPDRILGSTGPLSDEDYEVMKTHALIGANTLREVDRQYPGNAFVRLGIEVAESHHEKWNGAGYPHGLVGEDIPLVGRTLALADAYDAITAQRSYHDAQSHEEAREIIVHERGKHFDPNVVDAFYVAEAAFGDVRASFGEA